jgi:hypothetical protein
LPRAAAARLIIPWGGGQFALPTHFFQQFFGTFTPVVLVDPAKRNGNATFSSAGMELIKLND